MKKIWIPIVALMIASCNETKNTSSQSTGNIKTEFAADSLKTAEGRVLEIQQGKDGYTAKIQSTNDAIYFITISHANLNDPKQYKTVKVGDQIMVSGESWMAEQEEHITVKEIL
ncbi:MAG: hypothetical protein ABIP95_13415 [Pelobium sp.]